MPKVNIFLKKGENIDNNLNDLLTKHFDNDIFEKLKRFGGRIQISITAPYTDRKKQDNKLIINKEYVSKILNSKKINKDKLSNLNTKQLKEFAKIIDLPINSKFNKNQIILQIIDFINSQNQWKNISK